MKKKLLQIGIEVNSGSTGRIAEQIGLVAMKNGFESYITFARDYNPSQSDVIKIGSVFNIFFHVLRTRLFGDHLGGSKLATLSLIKKIKKLKPDIIHLHQLHGYYLHLPILFNFLKSLKTPVVWTIHDNWAFTEIPFGSYPKSLFLDKSKQNFLRKKKIFTNMSNIRLVGVSKWIRDLAKNSFLNNFDISTIPNGIDISVFYPRNNKSHILKKYNLNTQKKYLIASGTTWNFNKGILDYKKLSKLLPKNIILILVGIKNHKIFAGETNIKCISRTESQDELAELYSISEILLCLSYKESFGLTPIEAMACGTPAIVYDNTALPELVTKNTGDIVETGNISLVLSSIKKILNKGKEFYYQECINHVNNNYDKEITYNNYIKIYKELLK